MIQDWIERQPDLLGLDLLIIGREVATSHGGWIDLLGIDDEGDLAILELKRDRTPREVIAQVLDYASWVANLKTREVHDIALRYLKKLSIKYPWSGLKLPFPETLNESHTMVIIASSFDAIIGAHCGAKRAIHVVNRCSDKLPPVLTERHSRHDW
jgi:hypothetical protein